MATITLLLGPVGAGKTTFGLSLSSKESAVFFNLDEWMANLFRPDRPEKDLMAWYANRVERCNLQILKMAEQASSTGINVVLEIGLIRKVQREEFFNWIDERQIDLVIYIFDVDRSVRRERVIQRNKTRGPSFSMEVPMEFFEMASDFWEPVEAQEIEGRTHIVL
ncbi:MAG TPA: ATP-binding protein [Bdellovibrio sp.]|uniref:AAA family ATPase n=1 Tax=Bdellovibrio sp. TaxID=28201 RepID=UPI002EE68E63